MTEHVDVVIIGAGAGGATLGGELAEAGAKVVFLDTTNMSVGPDSIVKLDQFVYNGNGTAQTVSINATKGAFRFFSGASEHRAYKVTTPQAVIGVRGTTYDVFIANGQTYIKLQDGAVTACVRVGTACRDLDRPGDYLVVNDTSIQGPFPSNGRTFDFGSLCTGGASDLCRKTQFAMNTTPPPPPPSGGGYRPPTGPNLNPPTRVATLPPSGNGQPPVYIPPRGPGRPPVATIDPPVYVPPVWTPPGRPPHIYPRPPRYPYPPRPPQEGKPNNGKPETGKPQQEGKPYPGRPGNTRPPVEGRPNGGKPNNGPILRYGQTRGPLVSRWNAPHRFQQTTRMTQAQRFNSGM